MPSQQSLMHLETGLEHPHRLQRAPAQHERFIDAALEGGDVDREDGKAERAVEMAIAS